MQNQIFDAVMAAGSAFGIRPFGIRAMDSMRIEKSYRLIPRELSIEYAALESGLDRFVHLNKGDFIGARALADWQAKGFAWSFVTLDVDSITDADARGNEPIYQNGEIVGLTTGGNAHRLDEYIDTAPLVSGMRQFILLVLAAAGWEPPAA